MREATPPGGTRGAGKLELADVAGALVQALEAAGVGFVIAVDDGGPTGPRRAFVSDRAAEILGAPAESLLGQPAMLSIAPEEHERIAAMRARRLAEGAPPTHRFEVVIVQPSGARVPVETGVAPFDLRGQRATAAFFMDVSERKRTEAALAESEARFRTLVESSRDVALVCKGETLVYANPALARLLGYESVEALRGREARDFMHPDELQAMRDRWAALREHPDPMPVERRIRHKDGHYVTVEAHTIPINFDGSPAVLIFARDVSWRRAEQQRLLQQDRMAAVGTLAAGVAHEINNPLAFVMLNLDLVLRELPKAAGDPGRLADLRDKLQEARDGADRVGTIVRELLSFARSDESFGPVDVRRTIETAVRMVRSDLRQRGRLSVECGDLPEIDGNQAKLGQVVLNLLVNAMQALPPVGGHGHEVRVRAAADDRWVIIEVADTGPGIPEELLARVFEPFFTTKPAGEGTGLGLSICHGIVTAMGGEISARNLPARGAAFTVKLPVPLRYRSAP